MGRGRGIQKKLKRKDRGRGRGGNKGPEEVNGIKVAHVKILEFYVLRKLSTMAAFGVVMIYRILLVL